MASIVAENRCYQVAGSTDAAVTRGRPVAVATLAADHRLINGRAAAMFLTKIKEVIESGAFA